MNVQPRAVQGTFNTAVVGETITGVVDNSGFVCIPSPFRVNGSKGLVLDGVPSNFIVSVILTDMNNVVKLVEARLSGLSAAGLLNAKAFIRFRKSDNSPITPADLAGVTVTVYNGCKIVNTGETAVNMKGDIRVEGNATLTNCSIIGSGYFGGKAVASGLLIEGSVFMSDNASFTKTAGVGVIGNLKMKDNGVVVLGDVIGLGVLDVTENARLQPTNLFLSEADLIMSGNALVTAGLNISGILRLKDNAKVAVREGFGLHAKATDGYKSFAAHYAFKTDFCNIASGNEKGLVENLVGYARRNFLVPVPHVASLGELNQYLIKCCLDYRNKHNVQSRTQSVLTAYEEEWYYLKQIPQYRFDTSRTASPIVSDYSTVRFDKNNYSVPIRFLRKAVTVKGYANEVCIFYEGEVIATYDRIYGSNRTEYRLEHYIDLLERKPRCVFQAKPVRANVTKELLDWGRLLTGGNAERVKLLRLCVDHGEERILSIKEQFPGNIIPSVDMVRAQLHEIPQSNVVYFKNEVEITTTDLARYDEKCGLAVR